jgi:chromosome segregation ATPase
MELNNATEKSMLEHKLRDLEFQKGRLEREKQSLEGDLTACQKEIVGLKCSVAELSAAESGLRSLLETTQRQLQESNDNGARLADDVASRNAEIEELQVLISNFFVVNFCYLNILL